MCRLSIFLAWLAVLVAIGGPCRAETPVRSAPVRSAATQEDPRGVPLSPFAYHAVGDGVADDTGAISAWLNSGRPLACAGTFRILDPIVVSSDAGLYLQGSGARGCRLELASPRATLTVKVPDARAIGAARPEVVIHDVTFEIGAAIESSALRIDAPATIDRVDRGADLRDLSFTPEGAGTSIRTCLELTDVVNATVNGLSCRGRNQGYAAGSSGVLVDGLHAPGEIMLRDIDVYFVETGFRLEGSWQGVSIDSSVCVGCRIGVHGDGGYDGNEDWLRVLNSHFNVYDYGVLATNIFYTEIRGNLTFLNDAAGAHYALRDTMSPACYHFEIRTPTGAASVIRDNICDGHQRRPAPGITRYGVAIDGFADSTSSQVDIRTENVFQNLEVGTLLGPHARGVIVGPDIAVGVPVPMRSLGSPGANAAVAPVPF